jgi:hypothetical protein
VSKEEERLASQLFGNGQQQTIGAMEAAKEGLKEFRDHMMPGLTWDKIIKDIGHEIVQQTKQGAHELAAALFNGNAFVMYPRGTRDDGRQQGQENQNGHGVHGPQQEGQQQGGHSFTERIQHERQHERGGRKM